MKKPPRARSRRRSSVTPPPRGLCLAFRMIPDPDGTQGTDQCAADAYPHAARILSDAGLSLERELRAATTTVFPGWERDNSPNLAAVASFQVGFAVCWLLMTQMNGGAR
jgi:hypothetical protein